jgi:hypothetical protein
VWHHVEKLGQIKIGGPVDRGTHALVIELSEGIMTATPRSEPIRGVDEHRLVHRLQDTARHLLKDTNSWRPPQWKEFLSKAMRFFVTEPR